jgi:2-amino-4-hydroxy-6-hydroxymethyldihydropteridine diphosphokinase
VSRPKPHSVLLLLGGNLGDRADLLARARRLCGLLIGAERGASRVYETAAWGTEDQPPFLNQALALDTPYSPRGVLTAARAIEGRLGRRHRRHWGEREQDVDLLFHDQRIVDDPDLRIPHPRMAERRFVLRPLADLAPDRVHPVLGLTVAELLAACPDPLTVRPWPSAEGPPHPTLP